MEFTHDVFISYAHPDREFARGLKARLGKLTATRRIFFDDSELRAGDDWEAKLIDAIAESRCLVVLWSERAKESNWVTNELYSFLNFARTDPRRRLVFVNLQGANKAMQKYHQIVVPALQAAYPRIEDVAEAIWQDLVQRAQAGLDPDVQLMQVPLVVLTLTQADAVSLGADVWARLSARFHLPVTMLQSRYGPGRDDWRPFNGADTIAKVLDDVAQHVNSRLGERRIEWKKPADAFWDDQSPVARVFVESEFEKAPLAVLVVDPVALDYLPVYRRLMLFQDSLARSGTIVLTLAPFGGPRRIARLREALLSSGQPYFDPYLAPEVPPRRRVAAHCDWDVTGAGDIERMLLTAAGKLTEDAEPRKASAFLSHGAAR